MVSPLRRTGGSRATVRNVSSRPSFWRHEPTATDHCALDKILEIADRQVEKRHVDRQRSFARNDRARSETVQQLALAVDDEVADFEAADIRIVQIAELALREGYLLRKSGRLD